MVGAVREPPLPPRPLPSPSHREGDACEARRGCTRFTASIPNDYPLPIWIPASAGMTGGACAGMTDARE